MLLVCDIVRYMFKNTDIINQLFSFFGLNSSETEVYVFLLNKPALSVVEINRLMDIKRTRLYRILGALEGKQLIVSEFSDRGKIYKAQKLDQLKLLIVGKEKEIKDMEEIKNSLYEELSVLGGRMSNPSMVKIYRGMEGLKQISWKSAEAKDELRLVELGEMSKFLDYGYYEMIRRRFVENKVHVRELTNLSIMPAWTEVEEFCRDYWQCRYIDSGMFKIKHELLIYNDLFAIYYNDGAEIVCMEVKNEAFAKIQKQIFDFMWSNGLKMNIGKGGGGSI